MHIPKCGGTSIKKELASAFDSSKIFNIHAHASKYVVDILGEQESLHHFRNKLTLYALATSRYKLIMGHTFFSRAHFEPFMHQYDFVSLVRNPIDRFLSHYFYNKHKSSTHYKISDNLDSFLMSPDSKNFGNFLTRYFSGVDAREDLTTALSNLNHFSVLGTLESLEKFQDSLSNVMGSRLNFGHHNEGPLSRTAQTELVSARQLEKITDLCRQDLRLYEEVVKRT